MKESAENRVSYIIGYRQSSADRLTGLQFVLAWLQRWLPDLEIILVEQDERPVLDIPLPPNCRKYFIYNPGLYNRCWAFNVGVKKTDKEVIGFADSDMFMSKEDYLRCFDACLSYEAVNPNGNRVVNVDDTDLDKLTYKIKENRRLWTFAAGIMFMQRKAFEKIGGWDERFEGWGVEDDAISHIIRNSLASITLNCEMYHVEHARGINDGKTQPNYLFNRKIFEEISVLYGDSLQRYLKSANNRQRGDEAKYEAHQSLREEAQPKFVMAVLAYGPTGNLKALLESWDRTRDRSAAWTLIISDGGTSPETRDYLRSVEFDNVTRIIQDHHGKGHIFRINDIISRLSGMEFDLCFYADSNIRFRKPGWDRAYWQVIDRTGLGHLCFYDEKASLVKPYSKPLVYGDLSSRTGPLETQPWFFTITKEVIDKVGYFDSNIMGHGKIEFLDYTLRCARKGFNVPDRIFDLRDSGEYMHVVTGIPDLESTDYVRLSDKPEGEINKRRALLLQPRGYIPFNDLVPFGQSEKNWIHQYLVKKELKEEPEEVRKVIIRRPLSMRADEIIWIAKKRDYQEATGRINWNDGVSGICTGILRKTYNIFFKLRINWMIRLADRFSNLLIYVGIAFKKIDGK